MTLEELYRDVAIFNKSEPPIPDFLLYYDMAVRAILTRYPKKLLIPEGEYVTPESLEEGFALPDSFFFAVFYFVCASTRIDSRICDLLFEAADDRAEKAFRSIWREHARGKRLQGDRW